MVFGCKTHRNLEPLRLVYFISRGEVCQFIILLLERFVILTFSQCFGVLRFSSGNTSKVTNNGKMFCFCTALIWKSMSPGIFRIMLLQCWNCRQFGLGYRENFSVSFAKLIAVAFLCDPVHNPFRRLNLLFGQ